MKARYYLYITAGITVSLITLVLLWLIVMDDKQPAHQANKQKPLYWQAPMNPDYRRDQPGKSPMGMDLVPVYPKSADHTVSISPMVENNIGIRTARASMHKLNQKIHTVGYIQADEEKLEAVNSYSPGWIKELRVNAVGERVQKGDLLLKLYAPAVISAQQEYLLALKYNRQPFITASRQKLRTLGMHSTEIKQLTNTRQVKPLIGIYAPISGYVTRLSVREGKHITPSQTLLHIADLSTVWVLAEVYPNKTQQLKTGQRARITLSANPNQTFYGNISYIYPQVDKQGRTTRVRIPLENKHMILKPNMYADVLIYSPSTRKVLTVPKSALIRTGESNRVVLALGQGKFKSVEVTTGMADQQRVHITGGLQKGDKVVTSAQFLLDSESSTQAGLSRLSQSPAPSSTEDKPNASDMADHHGITASQNNNHKD